LGGVGGDEAEDFVDFAHEGTIFGFGEFAVGVAHILEDVSGLGAGVAIFLEEHGFFADAGEAVQETSECGGVAAEFFVERAGTEVTEGFEDVEGAELEGRVVELGGVIIVAEVGGGILADAGAFEEGLFEEPILVAAFFPLMDVANVKAFTFVAEALDNIRVRDTITKPDIDPVTSGFGQSGDFAVVAIVAGRIGRLSAALGHAGLGLCG
jgi:hypothetical protein